MFISKTLKYKEKQQTLKLQLNDQTKKFTFAENSKYNKKQH